MKKKQHAKKFKTVQEVVPQISYLAAAQRSIPQIKVEEVIEEPSLIEIVKTGTFKSVQKYIFKTEIDVIASNSNLKFWSEFLEHFPNLIQRGKIAENIIDKISLHECSLSVIGSSAINRTIQNNWINHLKAETLLVQGENILNIILKDKSAPTALAGAKQGVESIELSYLVYQSLLNLGLDKGTREFFLEKAEKNTCNIISDYRING